MKKAGNISFKMDNMIEFYLAGEQIICVEQSNDDGSEKTVLEFYDVSDPEKPALVDTMKQEGYYMQSRMDDSHIYLVTEKYNDYCTNKKNSDCVPEIDGCKVQATDIYMPECPDTKDFLTCSSVSLSGEHDVESQIAVLASGGSFYMSTNNIYICSGYIAEDGDRTEIMRIAVKDGELSMKAKGSAAGWLTDSFAINEYNGYLRTVLQEDMTYTYDEGDTIKTEWTQKTVLTILNEDLEEVGVIEDIAPGENIYSARFIGDTAYFVTYESVDPLFSVDLSDPENPAIIGELKIPGFSEYLHPYSDKLLLGIGYEAEDNVTTGLKMSMFNVNDPSNVTEENVTALKNMDYSECLYNYKALCISTEKNLFGFSCESYGDSQCKLNYVLCSYDEEKGFAYDKVYSGNYNEIGMIRGTYIGGTFYTIVYGDKIIATDLETMSQIGCYEL